MAGGPAAAEASSSTQHTPEVLLQPEKRKLTVLLRLMQMDPRKRHKWPAGRAGGKAWPANGGGTAAGLRLAVGGNTAKSLHR